MKYKYLYNLLPKPFFIKEYIKNKKPIKQISKDLNCSYTAIRNKLIKYNIQIRTKSDALKGLKKSKNHRRKISIANKGISKNKGKNNPNYGGKWYGKKIYPDWTGKNNPKYIDGRTPLIRRIYNSDNYKKWRVSIYERDNYTCKDCNKNSHNLEAHHKKGFVKIFENFLIKYNSFSIIKNEEILLKLAINYKPFWDITNGMTLCKKCHLKRHPKERSKCGMFK